MIFALLVGCHARTSVGDHILADVPRPDNYDADARAATRELRLYSDGLTTSLLLRAARLDPDFRRAMEAQRAHLMLLESAVREERLAASLAEAEVAYVFVLSADSQFRDDLRFGFGEAEPWRLRLFADGRPCTPESVTEIEPTPLDLQLYPHHTRWSSLWNVRFARDCGAGPLVLQVTGPHGTGEMGWSTETAE
ncbi:MAG: hypothetical protein Q8P41_04280 [Pseudomonadota bacterium]|nr:hypothetical protein [Pseudomonadota bacterium]